MDDYGDYIPPEGSESPIKFKGEYITPTGGAVALNFKYIYYRAPLGNSVGLNFTGAYTPPAGSLVALEFSPDEITGGDDQYVFPTTYESTAFGEQYIKRAIEYISVAGVPAPLFDSQHEAYLYNQYLRPNGVPVLGIGRPSLRNWNYQAFPAGFDALGFGRPNLVNTRRPLSPQGIKSDLYGRPLVYNLLQRVTSNGFASSLFGKPYVQGGVKYLLGRGFDSAAIGRASLINTTANQTARPSGIPAPPVGSHHVSPRSVFPFGILGTSFGSAFVQFPPRPVGWLSSAFGYPVIDYKTKQVRPAGISADEAFGYPVVFDPTRHLLVSSVLQAGVFGDTAIKNSRFVLKAEGFESLEFSVWASLESNLRDVTFNGFVATAFGVNSIRNKTPSLSPEGFDALQVPHGVGVGYAIRRVYTSGADLLALGRPKLTQTPSIAPKGFTGAAGHPTVWPRVRTLEVLGHDSFKAGNLDVWFRYRIIQLEGQGVGASAYGSPRIDHQHREILAHGSSHSSMGSVKIGQRNRSIAPEGIWEEFATGHMVGGLRFLRPVGYEATRWGTRIIPEITQVYARGFSNSYGIPTLRNKTNLILPAGITTTPDPVDQWGTAKLHNSRQFVSMFYDVDSELNPPKWPQWTLIENRDKVFRVTGTLMSSLGRAVIANKATPLLPSEIEAPAMPAAYKAGMVSFRIRPLRLEGIEAPYMSTWSRVFNDAAVIVGKGFDAAEFGTASLENTRRSFRFQGWQDSWFGYPMVAFRVRHIEFEGRYTIAPPPIRMPEVKLYTRYLEPMGYETYGSGAQSLSIHWTLITPRWTHRELFGEPWVHNVTPELRTRGRVSEDFGNAFVRLEWREVITQETFTQIIPKPIVAFRDRAIEVNGIRSMVFGDKLKVTKTGAPPYSEQYISLLGTQSDNGVWNDDGDGIWPPGEKLGSGEERQVPEPVINLQVIYQYHDTDKPMTIFGQAKITANTIRVEPGLQSLDVGEPLVGLKIRTIEVSEYPFNEFFDEVMPRISPHTIWAVKEAPAQAKANHPSAGLHYVDEIPGGGWRKGIGRPSVFLYTGLVNARGANHAAVGRPGIYNALSYIEPKGIKSDRYGWHTIPGEQISEQIESSNTMVFGVPKVGRPPYVGPQNITSKGLSATLWGANEIQLLHRQIYPRGFLSMAMGTRRGGDSPYMWQGLRIGELMPTIPAGFESDKHGEPWISFKVREILPEGFDSFACTYDITQFSKRMKVWRREVPNESTSIMPESFNAFESGTPNARPHVHYIRPDGNSDQYRKGAF